MATEVKAIIEQNDIFDPHGHNRALAAVVELWKLSDALEIKSFL
jgi:hypothetical protein